MSATEVQGLIGGIVTRAVQCSLRPTDLFYALAQLHVEVVGAGVSLTVMRKAIYQRMQRMEKLKDESWRDAVRDCVKMWEQARVKGH